MADSYFTVLSKENNRLFAHLSMDSSASSSHEQVSLEMDRRITPMKPPDIDLSLSTELTPPPRSWNRDHCDIPDTGVCVGSHSYKNERFLKVPRVGKKCAKRVDNLWGAWILFSFYFKPVLNDKSKVKIVRDGKGVSTFDKNDLNLNVFMVQHDIENIYMWVFKERPENALGKMQLRSYMNGHSQQGEYPFPFSVDQGFIRSHRMQRKHYRGLSNPRCLHGIELVPFPNLSVLDEVERRRWIELTGRKLNFLIPPAASDYSSWRNLSTEFEVEISTPPAKNNLSSHSKKKFNGSGLNLSTKPSNDTNGNVLAISSVDSSKKRKEFSPRGNEELCLMVDTPFDRVTIKEDPRNKPYWFNEFGGVMRNAYGPVTTAKRIYEDEQGFLVIISLPFVDLQKVKVSWRNTLTHGIIKVSFIITCLMPFIKRGDRTFKLTDPSLDHWPPREFFREISLSTRIPEDANIEAYYDGPGTFVEVLVPKLHNGPEEHEVSVCLRSHRVDA